MTTAAGRAGRTDLPTGVVTFLFTDIEGSTRLSQRLGDRFGALIDRHHAIIDEAIRTHGGTVVSTEGDAFFAAFPDPRAAVAAVAAAQRSLATEPWPTDAAVRVRMGLHTGLARLGGDDYAGVDVNRAARVAAAAHGGQVILSSTTVAALADGTPDGITLVDLGDVRLKDFDRFETVFGLVIEGLPSDFPPPRADRPGWLPEPLSSFLGREEEITAIGELLADARLVTLTGPGGAGKTRLSIEVARRASGRFTGGSWFVALEAIALPDLVLPEIADRLGVRASTATSLRESLVQRIAERPTLLVLDNLEQVVAVGPSLAELLREAPGLRILASSREALRVAGEREYVVESLERELAIHLFVDRAREVRPGLETTDAELAVIGRIVDRLDRLPLAIELAAARARLFAPRALLERLDERMAMLASGRRDLPERQRTLRGAIEWSYQLLDERERGLFARLAVFAGGGRLDDIEALVDPAGELGIDLVEGVASLADKSLVSIRDDPGGDPRVVMLETLREYAAERLAEDPAVEPLRERHALRFLELAERMEPELSGTDIPAASARLDADHDNVRAALDWAERAGRADVGLRIGGAIWRFWQQRSHTVEARGRLERLLAHASAEAEPAALARGAMALGGVVYWMSDLAGARVAYERALDAALRAGDARLIAQARYDLSFPVAILGDHEGGRRLMDESLAGFASVGDGFGEALVKEALAAVAVMGGDADTAWELEREVIDTWRSAGRRMKLTDGLMLGAVIQVRRGEVGAARALLDEGIAVTREIGDLSGTAGMLDIGAMVMLAEGRPDVAARLCGALQGLRDRGEPLLTTTVALRQPDPAVEAREQLGERYEPLFESGRAMPIEAAIELAAEPI